MPQIITESKPQRHLRFEPLFGYLARAAAGMLAGAAVLPGSIAPFGLALCIAAPQQTVLLYCVGSVLGSFAALPPVLALRQTVGLLLIGGLRLLLGTGHLIGPTAAGLIGSSLLSETLSRLGQADAGAAHWLLQSCLALALGLLYRDAFPALQGRGALCSRDWPGLLTVWSSLLCIVQQCLPGPFYPMLLLALPAVLLCAEKRIPALLPEVFGGCILAALATRSDTATAAVLLTAAWLAGRLASGRPGRAGALCALSLLAVFTAGSPAAFGKILLTAALSGVLFCLPYDRFLPSRILLSFRELLQRADLRPVGSSGAVLDALAGGLDAMSSGMEAVSAACARPADDPNSPIEAACDRVCSACTEKALCWGGCYDATQNALQTALAHWRSDFRLEFPAYFHCARADELSSALLRQENLRVLRLAGRIDTAALRRTVGEQYRALADGLRGAADGWQPGTPQPQWENRIASLCGSLQLPVTDVRAERLADGTARVEVRLHPLRMTRRALEELTAGIGRCCGQALTGRVGAETAQALTLCFETRPALLSESESVSRALEGGICGDVTETLRLGGRHWVLLCDGMGTGARAALDAKTTALFTARLLRAGFSCTAAARLVSAVLKAAPEEAGGCTLDAVCLEPDGTAQLFKAGAAASFLLREGRAHRLLEGGGLPLGCSDGKSAVRLTVQLRAGDRLIMVSDGVPGQESDAFCDLLAAQPEAAGAEALLAALLDGRPPQDDCTLVLLRVSDGG